eukprot:5732432-Lingulodinium_polyedra.AAC.1
MDQCAPSSGTEARAELKARSRAATAKPAASLPAVSRCGSPLPWQVPGASVPGGHGRSQRRPGTGLRPDGTPPCMRPPRISVLRCDAL